VLFTIVSLPASVLGNEAALRFGHHRAITVVMLVSAAIALAIGLSTETSPLLLLALVLIYAAEISEQNEICRTAYVVSCQVWAPHVRYGVALGG
jgi:hypothetical protein